MLELRNILERAAILCDGGLVLSEHLGITMPASPAIASPKPPPPIHFVEPASDNAPAHPPSGELKSMERLMIEEALQSARFNKSKAAQILGLTRSQLYVRMRRYGLD